MNLYNIFVMSVSTELISLPITPRKSKMSLSDHRFRIEIVNKKVWLIVRSSGNLKGNYHWTCGEI